MLVGAVQADLWFGKASLPQVMSERKRLQAQQDLNQQARLRNARSAAEVADLKEGEEMIEELARTEQGMVKANEILVRLNDRR